MKSKEAELGYFLRKDAWSQGFMTEVVRKICQLSFEEFGLKQLSIITHLENEASQRVALKSGFSLFRQFKEVIVTQEKCGIILNFGM